MHSSLASNDLNVLQLWTANPQHPPGEPKHPTDTPQTPHHHLAASSNWRWLDWSVRTSRMLMLLLPLLVAWDSGVVRTVRDARNVRKLRKLRKVRKVMNASLDNGT